MTRVAFTLIGGRNWTGGYNYLFNLIDTLAEYQSARITPILFAGEDCGEVLAGLASKQKIELVTTPWMNVRRQKVSLAQALFWGCDIRMRGLFKQHRIDRVFENAQFFGWRLGIPAIAWIPDFQHRALPGLFSRSAWWKREIGFRVQVAGGRTIMLSSEDARRDCESYYPSTRGHTRTVCFAVPPGPPLSFQEAREVADSYGLPEQFIFLPNQFWRHKNHLLVLEALSILKRRGKRMVVAASGKQEDPRDPGYFPGFLERLERHGLQQEFRLLGLIPSAHIRPLMRACVAMLNASLFEGWSTTVEEARALGTPMVLSDLDVHREQMGDRAIYFERNSAQSLADALENLDVLDEAQRALLAEAARANAANRVRKFSEDFADLVENCIKQHSCLKNA
jgi:glycosyltransferase involved in cell wall biosynthesis